MWLLVIVAIILVVRAYLRSKFGRCTSRRKLYGLTAIVTGANTGIGKEVARGLAKRGARVILGCRSQERGDAAKRDIIESTGNSDVHVRLLDLSSFKSVRKFADEINKTEPRLDILVNNAAAAGTAPGKKTENGIDLGMQINHYGPFLLTNLLLDLLKKSAPCRIIFVSSVAHKWATPDFNDLDKEQSGFTNYCIGKLFNIMTANILAEELKGTGVTCNSVHPGTVASNLWRNLPSAIARALVNKLTNFFQKSPAEGAEPILDLAISENLEEITGKYFSDCKEDKTAKVAQNVEYGKMLWKHSEEKVNEKFTLSK